jgi:hypothetical protein
MMMVSMRPESHEEVKIHEQGRALQFKFQLRRIEAVDVRRGRWTQAAHPNCNSWSFSSAERHRSDR